jgi:hypothetical protein
MVQGATPGKNPGAEKILTLIAALLLFFVFWY